ncbi:MAG: hypothetical protein M3N12_00055 [Verrucomicrobiota bacterium]|nr:hypothetical protein [Verrucomicrobiota bacterium]
MNPLGENSARSKAGHAAVNVATAVVAFIATCVTLHALLPAPNVPDVGIKLRFFAAHKDEFDTIFVGSSRIFHGVAPSVFDEVMAKAGVPSRTFNFGANGMYPPERFYVLEQILALKPSRLKRVFMEMDDVQVTWLPAERTSQRVLYWHDWSRTGIIIRKILNTNVHEQWTRKVRLVRRWRETLHLHLMLFSRNFCNFGRALDLVESFLDRNQIQWEELGPKLDGYHPLTDQISGERESTYEKELAREEEAQLGNVVLDDYAGQAYRHYARQIRTAGASLVLIVTPVYAQLPSQFSGPSPCLLLAYNNPAHYADLYQPEARIDEGHLNKTGAEKFTRLLAEDFLKKTRQP